MAFIKRTDGFNAAAAGRTLTNCVYRQNDEASLVAEVESVALDDLELTEQEFEAEKSAILAHNAVLPVHDAEAAQATAQKDELDALAAPFVKAVENVLTARQMAPMTPAEQAKLRDGAVYLASRGQFGKPA